MSWKKKYAISFLIALFAFAAMDGYRGNDVRVGAVIVGAAVWPVILLIALGSTVGDMVRGPSSEN